MLAAWAANPSSSSLVEAAARGDLAACASALWACRPPAYEFGLGIIVVLDAQERERRRESEAGKSLEQDRAAVEEARRRSDAARMEAEAAVARAEKELQKERGARRTREDQALANAAAAQRQADSLRTELERSHAEVEEHKKRLSVALQRARSLEDDLRTLRADTRALEERAQSLASRLDARDERALDEAVTVARQLSVSLEALQRRVREAVPAGEPPRERVARAREPAPVRRTTPQVPLGVVGDTPAGLEAMLNTPGVVLVIDGYNVAHQGWPDATPADQRERLGIAVTALCRRVRCEVVLVFDGDGTSGPRPVLRRGGVRVLFSDAGQEADELVILEVEALPRRVPVVVASSDAWVREHAAEQGAAVVGADTLARVLRPG